MASNKKIREHIRQLLKPVRGLHLGGRYQDRLADWPLCRIIISTSSEATYTFGGGLQYVSHITASCKRRQKGNSSEMRQ
jgi:hypothetical protein